MGAAFEASGAPPTQTRQAGFRALVTHGSVPCWEHPWVLCVHIATHVPCRWEAELTLHS